MPKEHLPRYEPSPSHEYKPLVVPPRDLAVGEPSPYEEWSPQALRRWRIAAFAIPCFFVLYVGFFAAKRLLPQLAQRQKLYRAASVPVAFPVAELALLDRDLKARFAEVPNDGRFGMSRVGDQHRLYVPHTWEEKQTVAKLKQRNLDVAFYVMSRRTWKNEHGADGYHPIQGPVYITRELSPPLPRKAQFGLPYRKVGVNEYVTDYRKKGRVLEPPGVEQFTPKGTPVPLSPPPDGLPEGRALRELGDRLMAMADAGPVEVNPGASAQTANGWHIIATSVRATDQACVTCHNGDPYTQREHISLGSPVGVAFYAYRKMEAHRQKQALHREGHEGASR